MNMGISGNLNTVGSAHGQTPPAIAVPKGPARKFQVKGKYPTIADVRLSFDGAATIAVAGTDRA